MSTQPLTNQGLSLLVIRANDADKSARFYRAIGMEFEQHTHPPCGDHFASLNGACLLEIYRRKEKDTAAEPITLGFQVSDLEEAIRRAVEFGGAMKKVPQATAWGRSATVLDPDGNIVLLMQKNA